MSGAIPSTKVYEDALVYAFRDISPVAPTHIILVPKSRDGLDGISDATDRHAPLLGHLMVKAAEIARAEGLGAGYRLVINNGEQGCQSVPHLHIHIIGGKQLAWPPGTGGPPMPG